MTDAEALILEKIDHVHKRIDDVHVHISELSRNSAALEVKVTELMGNGQPGKIRRIEENIEAHNKFMWTLFGLLGAGSLGEMAAHGSQLLKLLFK